MSIGKRVSVNAFFETLSGWSVSVEALPAWNWNVKKRLTHVHGFHL